MFVDFEKYTAVKPKDITEAKLVRVNLSHITCMQEVDAGPLTENDQGELVSDKALQVSLTCGTQHLVFGTLSQFDQLLRALEARQSMHLNANRGPALF